MRDEGRGMRGLGLLTLVCGLASHVLADPFVGYCYPAGLRQGDKVRAVVGGQGLGGELHGWVSGEGVEIVDIERVPVFTRAPGEGQRAWLGQWIRNLEDGVTAMPPLPKDEIVRSWPRNRWWETLDKLDALSLSIVLDNHFSPLPDPLQAAPAISERLLVTFLAAGNAPPGLRQFVIYNNNAASAPHPLFVTVEPHVAEPLYSPPPQKGKARPVREPTVCRTPVVLDGQILPGETDVFRLALTGGETLTCLLTGRELVPYLGDAVPGFFNPVLRLTDADGKELAFADDFHYLPDPVLTCRVEKTGTYRLEVRDNLYRGRDDFVYAVSCFTDGRPLPTPQERAFLCRPRPAAAGVWTDRVPCPQASVSFDFTVERPGRRDFELFARRIGSPLDGVLRLYGPLSGWPWKSGPLLATWDDVTNRLYVGSVPQAECDPSGSWEFTEPGDYRVSVSDRVGNGGEDYGFTLDVRPTEPGFEAYAVKSTFVVRPWKDSKLRFKVKVVRAGGFAGAVSVVGNADFQVESGLVAAESNETVVVAVPTDRTWTGLRRTVFTAVGETADGRRLERPVVPGNETEQAFAYTHILPTTDFLVFQVPNFSGPLAPPEWIDMPYDAFMPRRVIYPHASLADFKSDGRAALDALADVDVSLVKPPGDAGDGVLAAKFASSAAHVRKRNRGVFAVEEKAPGDVAAARAVLAGCTGFVTPKHDYAPGDERRVRTMARALALPHDNDLLLYVPAKSGNPLAGSLGATARRLRDGGWCYDFVTDKTLTNAPVGKVYRAVYVPQAKAALPPGTRELLEKWAKERRCGVIYAEAKLKNENRRLASRARRELFPKGLRFARFGRTGGEGWYFVHNPTSVKVTGEARFGIRGKARTAYRMDVRTGDVSPLAKSRGEKFVLSLEAGASAWIRVTAR